MVSTPEETPHAAANTTAVSSQSPSQHQKETESKGRAKESTSLTLPADPSKYRGIPPVIFIEDISSFVSTYHSKTPDGAEVLQKAFHDLYGKYKFMESKLLQQKKGLLTKIPEIKSALVALQYVKEKDRDLKTHFELSDSIYLKATIQKTDHVMLWLGANVMVEYPIDEALELLQKNLQSANTNLQVVSEDLQFLKDQITTSEVNIARVYNYKVELTRGCKSQQSSTLPPNKRLTSV